MLRNIKEFNYDFNGGKWKSINVGKFNANCYLSSGELGSGLNGSSIKNDLFCDKKYHVSKIENKAMLKAIWLFGCFHFNC